MESIDMERRVKKSMNNTSFAEGLTQVTSDGIALPVDSIVSSAMMLDPFSNDEVKLEDTTMSAHSIDDRSMFTHSQHQLHHGPVVGWQQQQQQPTTIHQISLQPLPANACLQPVLIHSINNQPSFLQLHQQQMMLHTHLNSGTHNLIPFNHQLSHTNTIPSLHGTPGYPPAIIPQIRPLQPQLMNSISQTNNPNIVPSQQNTTQVYTVQDRPTQQPVYNGINPAYPGLRILHTHPPILCVDNFLTEYECNFLIEHANDSFGPAPVVGKGAGEVSPSRTSSACYLAREDVPDILRKVSLLTGKPFDHCELPQVGRYFPTQQYLQHYDAFDLSTEDGRRFAMNGGQRTITVLIYLNTVQRGGATRFPALNLEVQPVRGMALVFFPATVDGLLDKMALHAALPAIDTKYVSQVWIRQSTYAGQPSKRLPQPLGLPFGFENIRVNQQQLEGGMMPQMQSLATSLNHQALDPQLPPTDLLSEMQF
jgi:prolyl 4-hydroxylase